MTDTIDNRDFQAEKLPSTLNVLTILSIIGSILQLISGIYSFATAKSNFEKKDEVLAQMNNPEAPAWAKNMMPDPEQYTALLTKSLENRIPIFAITVITALLCLYGALQMRKRKKQGFTFYTIGELLPLATTFAFLGTSFITGIFAGVMAFAIPIIFVILYYTQRKHLIY